MKKLKFIWQKAFYLWIVVPGFCFLLLSSFQPKPALACSGPTKPADWKPPTIQERVDAATTIIEGTVKELTPYVKLPSGLYRDIAMVEVHQYFKGKGPALVEIVGFGVSTMCLTPVKVGERAIFLTWGSPDTNLEVGTYSEFGNKQGLFIGYNVKEPVSDDLITQITQVSKQQPFIPGQPTATPVPPTPIPTANAQANLPSSSPKEGTNQRGQTGTESENNNVFLIIISVLTGLVGLIAAGTLVWRRRLKR